MVSFNFASSTALCPEVHKVERKTDELSENKLDAGIVSQLSGSLAVSIINKVSLVCLCQKLKMNDQQNKDDD